MSATQLPALSFMVTDGDGFSLLHAYARSREGNGEMRHHPSPVGGSRVFGGFRGRQGQPGSSLRCTAEQPALGVSRALEDQRADGAPMDLVQAHPDLDAPGGDRLVCARPFVSALSAGTHGAMPGHWGQRAGVDNEARPQPRKPAHASAGVVLMRRAAMTTR